MIKGILLVDYPESCDKCDLLSECAYCQARNGKNVIGYTVSGQKPEWCPVKRFPVKTCTGTESLIGNTTENKRSYAEGWNACIDSMER